MYRTITEACPLCENNGHLFLTHIGVLLFGCPGWSLGQRKVISDMVKDSRVRTHQVERSGQPNE